MSWFSEIKKITREKKQIEASAAYNLLASTYDEQASNPIIYLDDIVFTEMFAGIDTEGKIVVDIGCGTGRHWNKFLAKKPMKLIGYDISNKMLDRLRVKFPGAQAYLSQNDRLKELRNESCDLVVSNLVIGYIKNLTEAFSEWNRVLKAGGQVLITDFHPEALKTGATRSFRLKERLLLIKNYLHPLKKIKYIAKKTGWMEINFIERKIDDTIKTFYEKNNSLEVFNKTLNTLILFGCHFKKAE